MLLESFFDAFWYTYLILPLMVFIGRILDVSMGTVRVVFISRGFKNIAPIISFFEILIWLLVARQVLVNIANPITYVAYAGGFAAGTYIGMRLEEKLSVGKALLRIITEKNTDSLVEKFKKNKYGITIIQAKGTKEEVKMIFSVIDRKQLKEATKIIKEFDSDAFYTIEDIRFSGKNGPAQTRRRKLLGLFDFGRKAK